MENTGIKRSKSQNDGILKIPGLWILNSKGALKIEIENIMFCHHKKDLTFIFYSCGRSEKIRVPLKKIEEKLCGKRFFRCHRNFLINLDYAQKDLRDDDTLIFPFCRSVPVARRKKSHLLMILDNETAKRDLSA